LHRERIVNVPFQCLRPDLLSISVTQFDMEANDFTDTLKLCAQNGARASTVVADRVWRDHFESASLREIHEQLILNASSQLTIIGRQCFERQHR
jgi:hypothetical protein